MRIGKSLSAFSLLLTSVSLACNALPTASTDQVPVGNWPYSAMMHLAAHDYVPGMSAQRFMGDWQFNREQMATIVVSTARASGNVMSAQDRALLSRLAAEFSPEIRVEFGDAEFEKLRPYMEASESIPTASIEPRLMWSDEDTDAFAIYHAAGFGLTGKYVTAAVTASNLRRKFEGDAFSNLETAVLMGNTPNWNWEIGKDYLSWGPGYTGSMILSDNSPSFPLIKLSKDFNFGRHIGNIKITQFASRFTDNGKTFYLLGRRWEKLFSDRLHVGVNETAKTSKAPEPYAYILPSLYLYEHIKLDDVDEEWNALISIDATYTASDRFQGYVDFVVDDMKAPGFLRDQPAWDLDRKIGYLVGGYWPNITGDCTTGLRLEYIFTDPGTYGPTREAFPDLAYTHDGFVIGNPVGGNSSAIYVRLDKAIGGNWAWAVSYLGRVPTDRTGINSSNTHQFSALVSRDISPSFSITARYESLRLPAKEDRFQLGASYAF